MPVHEFFLMVSEAGLVSSVVPTCLPIPVLKVQDCGFGIPGFRMEEGMKKKLLGTVGLHVIGQDIVTWPHL